MKKHNARFRIAVMIFAGLMIAVTAAYFALHKSYVQQRWDLTWDGLDAALLEKSTGNITCLETAPNGEVWGCTDRGLIHFDGNQWTFTTLDALLHVSDVAIAPDGQVWALNSTGEVFRYDGSFWMEETGSYHLNDLTFTPDGTLWAATADGLASYNGTNWIQSPLDFSTGNNASLWCATTAPDGSLWVGNSTINQTLYHVEGEIAAGYQPQESYGYIQRVSVSPNGTIWMYSMGEKTEVTGLSQFKDGIWTTYNPERLQWMSMKIYLIYAMDSDRDGAAWIGTTKGACRFNGRWCQPVVRNETVYAVHTAADGSVWLGLKNAVIRLEQR